MQKIFISPIVQRNRKMAKHKPHKKHNYPEHIQRKKEEKPRKPGGGCKPTGENTTSLSATVSKAWKGQAQAKAKSMGISLDKFSRDLLYESSRSKYPDDFPDENLGEGGQNAQNQ